MSQRIIYSERSDRMERIENEEKTYDESELKNLIDDEDYSKRFQDALIEGFIHGDIDNLAYILDNDWCFDAIKLYLLQNVEEQFLSAETKKNLYFLVEQVRNPDIYTDNQERLKKWNWCNEIVGLLNTATDQNKVSHYRREVMDRGLTKKWLFAFEVEYNLPTIYLSIMEDMYFLESLDSENDFYNEICRRDIIEPFISYSIHKIILKEKLPLELYDLYKIRAILYGKQQLRNCDNLAPVTVEDIDGNEYSYSITEEEYQKFRLLNNEQFDREVLYKINRLIEHEKRHEKQKVISKKK